MWYISSHVASLKHNVLPRPICLEVFWSRCDGGHRLARMGLLEDVGSVMHLRLMVVVLSRVSGQAIGMNADSAQ